MHVGLRGRSTVTVRQSRRRAPLHRSRAHTAVLYVAAAFMAMFTLFPLYWALVTAFRPASEVVDSQSLIPSSVTLENFSALLSRDSFIAYCMNSVIVSVAVMVVTLVSAVPLAYLLLRTSSRIVKGAAVLFLLAYMVPEVLMLIPVYIGLVNLNLVETRTGLVIALLPVTVPLAVWLMMGFLRTLPYEVEEASLVDGASWLQIFLRIVLPMARPGLIAAAIFTFIFAWVDYLIVSVLITSQDKKTLAVGLAALFDEFELSYGQIMAAVLLMTLPMLIAVAIVGQKLVSGLAMGATKE